MDNSGIMEDNMIKNNSQYIVDENEFEEDEDGSNIEMDANETKAGRWTDEEHAKFLEALHLYGKNWNKVHRHVGSRTSAQTRSHAQKYFNKLMKKNTREA